MYDGSAVAALPPLSVLALVGAAMVVLVPLSMLLRGFGNDRHY